MPGRNLLLSAIPAATRQRLLPYAKTVDLAQGKVLHRPGQDIDAIHFPLSCLISVTITMRDGRTCEVGVVGSREMVGINAFMGGRETNQTEYVTQVAGQVVQMPADLLLEEFDSHKSVRDVLLRYTQAYVAQLSQNAACNRMHDLPQRLARWLLESRDRVQSDDVDLTHEFIGHMLGVRRAGVSEGMAALQAEGIIHYGRGKLRVENAPALEEKSCECYQVLRDEYDRLLESMYRSDGGTSS